MLLEGVVLEGVKSAGVMAEGVVAEGVIAGGTRWLRRLGHRTGAIRHHRCLDADERRRFGEAVVRYAADLQLVSTAAGADVLYLIHTLVDARHDDISAQHRFEPAPLIRRQGVQVRRIPILDEVAHVNPHKLSYSIHFLREGGGFKSQKFDHGNSACILEVMKTK